MCQRVTAHNTPPLGALDRYGPAHFGADAAAHRLARGADGAAPGGSTRLRPESPRPSPDAPLLRLSGDHATFFARVLRIRTGNPVFGALPMRPQTLQRPADTFLTQVSRGDALLLADLGGQSERPHPRGLVIGARRLVQHMLEPLTVGGIEDGRNALGARRLLGYTRQAVGIKSMDNVAHGLHGAAHQLGNGPGGQTTGTRQNNLRTTDAAGSRRTTLGCQLRALLIGSRATIKRWCHDPIVLSKLFLHKLFCGNALGRRSAVSHPESHLFIIVYGKEL